MKSAAGSRVSAGAVAPLGAAATERSVVEAGIAATAVAAAAARMTAVTVIKDAVRC